jgi:hypothetical protein
MAGTGPYYDNVGMTGSDSIRIPTEVFGSGNPSGTIKLLKAVAHSYGSGTADWNLNPAETAGSVYSVTSASGAANAIFPVYVPGKVFVVTNSSGQTITFLVKGKTGIAVATAKAATLFMDPVALDVQRVTADTTINV